MDTILLIAADWQFRTMVRAQLLEEGHEVQAFPGIEVAEFYLQDGGPRPRVTVVDTQGLRIEPGVLSRLWELTGQAPLLLCGGLLDHRVVDQDGMPPVHLLVRPFRVGDVVAQVRRLGRWPQTDHTET